MKKVMIVLDTPAEAIRICPVIDKLKQMQYTPVVFISEQVETAGVMDQILALFNVEPSHVLSAALESKTLNQLTAYSLNELSNTIKQEQIDATIVCGNTRIAFVAALASYYNDIRVTQVQPPAGNDDEASAFLGKTTEALMAPLATNRVSLGLEPALSKITTLPSIHLPITNSDTKKIVLFDYLGKSNQRSILEKSFQAMKHITNIYKEVIFVIPIKLTSLVMELANQILKGRKQIYFVKPFNILEYQSFMRRAWLVMSDNTRCLEEAQILGLPALIMKGSGNIGRHQDQGVGTAINFSKVQIVNWMERLLLDAECYETIKNRPSSKPNTQSVEQVIDLLFQNS
ncbi:UDP-N-acetylglucosamine 2-epimerase [Listeria riparia]|uniref:UDP-N-acetylglucosamine 2-epimerase (non-hydrolyzing) n=1 Tax=Listeria riparia FSL S10-1204 TaxID=1265816 RepID=W7DBT8_9LIST|nr:UDP-N-acetylglucosamine 2-epimerase [Listeria riparia]EUJ42733.1 UDP-N-acetyl-glucosamine-2-epimerase [Listeria riparia FSL S10-1204]